MRELYLDNPGDLEDLIYEEHAVVASERCAHARETKNHTAGCGFFVVSPLRAVPHGTRCHYTIPEPPPQGHFRLRRGGLPPPGLQRHDICGILCLPCFGRTDSERRRADCQDVVIRCPCADREVCAEDTAEPPERSDTD